MVYGFHKEGRPLLRRCRVQTRSVVAKWCTRQSGAWYCSVIQHLEFMIKFWLVSVHAGRIFSPLIDCSTMPIIVLVANEVCCCDFKSWKLGLIEATWFFKIDFGENNVSWTNQYAILKKIWASYVRNVIWHNEDKIIDCVVFCYKYKIMNMPQNTTWYCTFCAFIVLYDASTLYLSGVYI